MTIRDPAPDARAETPAGTPGFGRFFLPGPTEVRPEILAAQARPMIGHRGKGFEALFAELQPALQRVFRTARPVYIATCSATGLMEAAVRNGVRRRVLSLVNGAFSERFHRIALACGCAADALEVPLGQAHTAEMLRDRLRGGAYDAVTVVHSESSTGVLNPLAELAAVVRESGDVILLVDTVTSMAGTLVDTDAWGLDFTLTGSQKALALPPGLAFAAAHPRMLERARGIAHRGVYFDLLEFEANAAKNQAPNTPAVSLIYALAAQLERVERETVEVRWARHAAMRGRTEAWVEELRGRGTDVAMLPAPGFRSPTVSCIRLPVGRTGTEVTAAMKSRGFTIATGYGALKEATIRIGHMGDHTVAELDTLLGVLGEVLAR